MVEYTDTAAGEPQTSPELRQHAEKLLVALTRRPDAVFREGQFEAVEALIGRRERVLVVQRTGWGKSAVYFVATGLARAAGAGPTLLISPLLALMRDQVQAAARAGIKAVALNSANAQEWKSISKQLAAGDVDVLLVSPERLNNPRFRDEQLPTLLAECGLLVVDEAHCISDWGHDFRPDYRRIRSILADLSPDVPVLATTATANERVVFDVEEQLGAAGGQVRTIRGGLARQALRLAVVQLDSDAERLAWLIDNLPSLPGSGIVYTLTIAAAEATAAALRDAGISALDYSGRTDVEERQVREKALLDNEVKVLVATSALGMGFDKPDLGFVVHLGAPSSPVAYYQQVGRAGRATDSAEVVLLPFAGQEDIWAYFAQATMPDEAECSKILELLNSSDKALSIAALETHTEGKRSRLEVMLKMLAVEGATRREAGGWVGTGQPWHYDAARYERVAEARRREEDLMRQYQGLTTCRMAFLQSCLDDKNPQACGRCDVCAGPWLPTTVSEGASTSAAKTLSSVGVELEPRRQWPSGMANLGISVRGKIPEEVRCEPGRALARLSDLGWGVRLRQTLAVDQEAPLWLLDACVEVLKGWDWQQRPANIVVLPSAQNPILLQSVAQQLAQVGRLNYAGVVTDLNSDVVESRDVNSAFRLAAVWGRYTISPELAANLGDGAATLLLTDRVDSRWSVTVVGRAMREAGSGPVLPFALAVEG